MLAAIDLAAQAVLLAVNLPSMFRSQRAAILGAVAADFAVHARFFVLEVGGFAGRQLV